jgi:hypothetical protein
MLPGSKAGKERLAITSYELSCELDNVYIQHCHAFWDVCRIMLVLGGFYWFAWRQHRFGRDFNGSNRRWCRNCNYRGSRSFPAFCSFYFLYFMLIIGVVWVASFKKIEFGIICFIG